MPIDRKRVEARIREIGPVEAMRRIESFCAESLLEMSDEEILEMAREAGIDVDQAARAVEAVIRRALAEAEQRAARAWADRNQEVRRLEAEMEQQKERIRTLEAERDRLSYAYEYERAVRDAREAEDEDGEQR